MRRVHVVVYLGLCLAPSALGAQQPAPPPAPQPPASTAGNIKLILADTKACPLVHAALHAAVAAMAAAPTPDKPPGKPKPNNTPVVPRANDKVKDTTAKDATAAPPVTC